MELQCNSRGIGPAGGNAVILIVEGPGGVTQLNSSLFLLPLETQMGVYCAGLFEFYSAT